MSAMRLVAVLAALAGLNVGCVAGGDGARDATREAAPQGAPAALTQRERERLRSYEAQIVRHCARVSRSLVDPSEGPTPSQQARAFAAADALVRLAAAKPRAPLDAGQDLRLFLSDVVENLEGANCDPRMVARLERGLAGIPLE